MSQFARHSCARLGLIGLGSLSAALPLCAQADGFLDDAKATLNLRNAYFNRNFSNPTNPQAKAEEWTQNFILDAKSGFTQGTVGFGIDVLGLYSQKLDGGKGQGDPQARRPRCGAGGVPGRPGAHADQLSRPAFEPYAA